MVTSLVKGYSSVVSELGGGGRPRFSENYHPAANAALSKLAGWRPLTASKLADYCGFSGPAPCQDGASQATVRS